jgi:hypothetical protein
MSKYKGFNDAKSKERVLQEIINLVKTLDPSGKTFKKAGLDENVGAGVSESLMEKYFDIIWSGPARLMKVAVVLTDPLKERRDYWGVSRLILQPWEIGVGDIPYADKDIKEFAAVVSGGFGEMPIVEPGKIRRVIFPTFELKRAYPLPYAETYIRRFDAFNRAKERVAIANAIAEDSETFKIIDVASIVGPNPWIAGGTYLSKSAITLAMSYLEANQLGAATILLHPNRMADIRNWSSSELDPVTLNQLIETGRVDKLMGMNVVMSAKADPNAVYVLTTPDKLGRIVVRKDLEVKVMDHVLRSTYFICSYAIEGFGIHNTYGVVRIEFGNRTKEGGLGQVYHKTPTMVAQVPY